MMPSIFCATAPPPSLRPQSRTVGAQLAVLDTLRRLGANARELGNSTVRARKPLLETYGELFSMPAIIKGPALFSDNDLQRLSEINPGWQFERSDDGALLVSPTATPGGSKSGEAFAQLYAYAKRTGGKAYDAQTGFKTPGGGVVSPDAAWISEAGVRAHAGDDGFWQIMPDVVIEVASKTDEWPMVKRKIDKYFDDGATYALAIDPKSRETYERGNCPRDLVLDIGAVMES